MYYCEHKICHHLLVLHMFIKIMRVCHPLKLAKIIIICMMTERTFRNININCSINIKSSLRQ